MHFGKISFMCTLFFSFLPSSCSDYLEDFQEKYFNSGFTGSIQEYEKSLAQVRQKRTFRPLSAEEEKACGAPSTISKDPFTMLSHQKRRLLLLGKESEGISDEPAAPSANPVADLNKISLSLLSEFFPEGIVAIDTSDVFIDEYLAPDSKVSPAHHSQPSLINDDDGKEHFKKHPGSRFTVRTTTPLPVLQEEDDLEGEKGLILDLAAQHDSFTKTTRQQETSPEYQQVTSRTSSADSGPQRGSSQEKVLTPHFHTPMIPTIKERDRVLAACQFHIKHSQEKFTFEELAALVRCLDDSNNEDLKFFKTVLKTHATIQETDEFEKTILWSLIPYDRSPLSLKKLDLLLKAGASPVRRHIGNESFIEYLKNSLCSFDRKSAREGHEFCQKFLRYPNYASWQKL